MTIDQENLTSKDVMKFLHIAAPSTLTSMIREMKIPHVKIGRIYLYPRIDFERWWEQRKAAQMKDRRVR